MAPFLGVSGLYGQEVCSEEVKLLLSPTEVQAAVPALEARRKTKGRIYFYDTPSLDLLAKGVVLRLREGAEIDITAKLRPVSGEKFVDPTGGSERYKCEVDLNDGVEAQSFSVQAKDVDAKVPETGEGLFQLLSEGQKRLLEDAKAEIDWKRVRRVADIRSTSWTTRKKGPMGKLSLELWEWPGGSVLEVSTKVAPDAGLAAYGKLRELAKKNGLALSANQSSKTAIALREIKGVR
jgi:CYTH domain